MITSDQQMLDMTTSEITKLLERFAQAQTLSDLDALSELLTDDFKLVGPLGFVLPKHQWLEQFHSGALQIESLEWDELDIRTYAYANLAIATGKLTQAATYAQNPSDGQFRVTAIAIGHGTTWHLAGLHYSPIATPGPPRSADAPDDPPNTD